MAPVVSMIKRPEENSQWREEKDELERKIQRLETRLENQSKTRELEKELLVLDIREDERLKWQIKALEAQLDTKDQKINLLKDKVSESERVLDRYEKVINGLTHDIRGWRDRFHDEENQREALEAGKIELESEIKMKSALIESLQAKDGNGQSEEMDRIATQAWKIHELQTKLAGQEGQIRVAQESVARLQKNASHDKMDENEIRLKLENKVLEKIKDWAQSWATQERDLNSARYISPDVLEALQKVSDVRMENVRKQLQGLSPRIIVNALLSRYLQEKVFQEPFHLLGSGIGGANLPQGTGFSDAMMAVYNTLLQG
jgi:hypothetical protein